MLLRHARRFLLVLPLAACHANIAVLDPVPAADTRVIDLCSGACRDSMSLTYLGVSGFLVRHGGAAVMTAPSFTHRSLLRTMLPWPFRYDPDTALIDRQLHGLPVQDVGCVLVGHAHYDHLVDVPYVARRWTPGAAILGSRTTAHTLAGDPRLRGRTRIVADSAASDSAMGGWIYLPGGGLRILALESSHAPNLGHYTFAEGHLERNRTTLPRNARGWVEGEVYAYLIDVIAPDSTPRFRIYYQDAAADSQHVRLPPMASRDAHRVDVAILCVGNYAGVPDNPQVILGTMRPRFVVLSHWEDFFRSPLEPLRVIPRTDTEALVARLRAAVGGAWLTPSPMLQMTVRF